MPFKSDKQRKYLNAHPEILGEKTLEEFNKASKVKKLKDYIKDKKEGK